MSQENVELKAKNEKPILIFVWYHTKRGLLNNRLCPFRHNVEYHARLGYQCIVVFYVENEADLSLSNEQFLLRATSKSDSMASTATTTTTIPSSKQTTTTTRTTTTTTTTTTTKTPDSSTDQSEAVLFRVNLSTGFTDKLRLNSFGNEKTKVADYDCVEAKKTKKIFLKKNTGQRNDFQSPSTSSHNEYVNQMYETNNRVASVKQTTTTLPEMAHNNTFGRNERVTKLKRGEKLYPRTCHRWCRFHGVIYVNLRCLVMNFNERNIASYLNTLTPASGITLMKLLVLSNFHRFVERSPVDLDTVFFKKFINLQHRCILLDVDCQMFHVKGRICKCTFCRPHTSSTNGSPMQFSQATSHDKSSDHSVSFMKSITRDFEPCYDPSVNPYLCRRFDKSTNLNLGLFKASYISLRYIAFTFRGSNILRVYIEDELFKWGFNRDSLNGEKFVTYVKNVECIYENVNSVRQRFARPISSNRNTPLVNDDAYDNDDDDNDDDNSNCENFHERLIMATNNNTGGTIPVVNSKRENSTYECERRKVDARFSLHELYTRCVISYFKYRYNFIFPAIYDSSSLPAAHCLSYLPPIERDFVDDDCFYREFNVNDDSYEISYDKYVRPIFSTDYEYCSFFLRRLTRDLEVACASLRFRYGNISATIDSVNRDATHAPNYAEPHTRVVASLKYSDCLLNLPDKFSFSKLRNSFLFQLRKFRDFEDTVAFIRWQSAPEIVKRAREKHDERNAAFLTRSKKFIEILERNLNVERITVPRNGFDDTSFGRSGVSSLPLSLSPSSSSSSLSTSLPSNSLFSTRLHVYHFLLRETTELRTLFTQKCRALKLFKYFVCFNGIDQRDGDTSGDNNEVIFDDDNVDEDGSDDNVGNTYNNGTKLHYHNSERNYDGKNGNVSRGSRNNDDAAGTALSCDSLKITFEQFCIAVNEIMFMDEIVNILRKMESSYSHFFAINRFIDLKESVKIGKKFHYDVQL